MLAVDVYDRQIP